MKPSRHPPHKTCNAKKQTFDISARTNLVFCTITYVGNSLLARRLGGSTQPAAVINNSQTLRPTFPSCAEARRLHPVGALARPHSAGGLRVRARQGPAPLSRRTPGPRPAPSTSPSASSTTARPSAQLFQVARRLGGYTQWVRSRAPTGSKPRRLRSAAGRHQHLLLHRRPLKPSAQLFQVARRLGGYCRGDDPRVCPRRRNDAQDGEATLQKHCQGSAPWLAGVWLESGLTIRVDQG